MPSWLPSLFPVDQWTQDTYENLYELFCRDIRDSRLRYRQFGVWIFPDIEDGKERIFWHLTSRMQKTATIPRRKQKYFEEGKKFEIKQRLPDLRRCERLPWVKPIIEHSQDSMILSWDYCEGDGTIKTYVWLKEHDFVVIMKKYKNNSRRLITSFCVDKEYKRIDFERKYKSRLN